MSATVISRSARAGAVRRERAFGERKGGWTSVIVIKDSTAYASTISCESAARYRRIGIVIYAATSVSGAVLGKSAVSNGSLRKVGCGTASIGGRVSGKCTVVNGDGRGGTVIVGVNQTASDNGGVVRKRTVGENKRGRSRVVIIRLPA